MKLKPWLIHVDPDGIAYSIRQPWHYERHPDGWRRVGHERTEIGLRLKKALEVAYQQRRQSLPEAL